MREDGLEKIAGRHVGGASDRAARLARDAVAASEDLEGRERVEPAGERLDPEAILLDPRGGEWEWVHTPAMDTSRRRFFL